MKSAMVKPMPTYMPPSIAPTSSRGETTRHRVDSTATFFSSRIASGGSAFLAAAVILTGCGDNEYVPPPPPVVTGAQPAQSDVVRYLEYTGTTRAAQAVTVRARVEGFLKSMHFKPGDFVEQGALLFVIDPEPFELTLKAATANVTSRQAELDLAQTEFERTRTLYKRKTTSEIKYIQARARRDTSAAKLALAEADARSAELDVGYANIKAPLSGRIGRNLVDIGNLVGAGEATALTEIVDYSPLHVYFYISERDVLAIQETSARRRKKLGVDYEHRPPAPVYVGRANDEGYPHIGTIDYSALQIDAATGTFEVRGILTNHGSLDTILVPGTFVRVQIPIGEEKDALLVPERALGADQNGRFVLVVSEDGLVEQRSVRVGPERRDALRVVEDGISANDWVIINGLQRARPGAKVAMEKSTTPLPEKPRPIFPPQVASPATDKAGAAVFDDANALERDVSTEAATVPSIPSSPPSPSMPPLDEGR